MSDAWHEFRREVFGDPYLVWHEGADVGALVAEHERGPERAERMVRAGVAEQDHVAVESLGALARAGRAPSDAAALLRSALPAAHGVFRVRAAQVLCELTGDDEHVSEVAAVLEGFGHWGDRIDAAMTLPLLPITPRSLAALHRGVLDPEYLVRYHSANGLLALAGRRGDIAHHRRFAQLTGEDAAARRAIADELLGAFGVRTAVLHGDRAGFAVELGAADYAAPHRRAARVYLAGTEVTGPDRHHVPALRNIGVYTTRPVYADLRATLEHLGFSELPESVALREEETAATLAAVTAALDFDLDVSRWRATDLLVGDRSRLALEIGPADQEGSQLRTCTLWLDGAIATPFDNTAYVPQFVHSLRTDAARYRAGWSPDFGHWGPTTDELAAELHPDGTLRYRLLSRIDGVGDREGVVRVGVDEIIAVLDEAAGEFGERGRHAVARGAGADPPAACELDGRHDDVQSGQDEDHDAVGGVGQRHARHELGREQREQRGRARRRDPEVDQDAHREQRLRRGDQQFQALVLVERQAVDAAAGDREHDRDRADQQRPLVDLAGQQRAE